MNTEISILCCLIGYVYGQTTAGYDTSTQEYGIIEEDLLRVHADSNVTYTALWNRIGFNGYDHDKNRRRDIIDEWDTLKPDTVILFFCDVLDTCDTNSELSISLTAPQNGNISRWNNVPCTVDSNNGQCSFGDEIEIPRGSIKRENKKFFITSGTSGTTIPTNFLLLRAEYNETLCLCDCEYYEKMEAAKEVTYWKKSMAELKEELGPQLKEMSKNLTVEKSGLSSFVNKKVSKGDERTSSKNIGLLGILFLTLEISAMVILDLLSFRQHFQFFKDNWVSAIRRLCKRLKK